MRVGSAKHEKALVTLAVGERYIDLWRRFCEATWRGYADKHGYDVICFTQPLDTSERAQRRSLAWQKLLVLSQDVARDYDRVVWVDSDIVINVAQAPCIAAGIPPDRAGAVELWAEPSAEIYGQALERLLEYWGPSAIRNRTAEEYHTAWGLPGGLHKVVQSGVMVLSPEHHRSILEDTYYCYEEKGGAEWNLEMRPLSYELQTRGSMHWLDYRFNLNWWDYRFMHYMFLVNWKPRRDLLSRAARRVGRKLGLAFEHRMRRACVNAAYWNSYFLHVPRGTRADMALLDLQARSWRDCRP